MIKLRRLLIAFICICNMCVCSAEGNEFENWLYARVASLYDVEYSDEQIIEYINKQVGCKDNAISGNILRSKYTVGRDAYLLAYIALDDNSLNTLLKTNAFDWKYNDVTDSIVDSINGWYNILPELDEIRSKIMNPDDKSIWIIIDKTPDGYILQHYIFMMMDIEEQMLYYFKT